MADRLTNLGHIPSDNNISGLAAAIDNIAIKVKTAADTTATWRGFFTSEWAGHTNYLGFYLYVNRKSLIIWLLNDGYIAQGAIFVSGTHTQHRISFGAIS